MSKTSGNKRTAKSSQNQRRKSGDQVKVNKSKSGNSKCSVAKSSSSTNQVQSITAQCADKQAFSATKQEMSTALVALELENLRKRLCQLDAECREKVDEEVKKNEEVADNISEQVTVSINKAIKELQEQFRVQMEAAHKELDKKQAEELARIVESNTENQADEKRTKLEKEIEKKKAQTEEDIASYRTKKEADRDEQIRRLQEQIKQLKEQCENDINRFAERSRETSLLMIEQLKQCLELEIKNNAQKDQLSINIKIDEVKARYSKSHNEAIEKLNQSMAQAINELRSKQDAVLADKLAESKKKQQALEDQVRGRVEEKFRKERIKLVATIEEMETQIKCTLASEQRELEQRLKKKAHLLEMLSMQDTRNLPDEELIIKRYKFKIDRGQIMTQSSASTIYVASRDSNECYCKVTMLSKWSVRHRVDFVKYTTRLARYLTANYDKAPYFVKIIDIMATESKVYTFMEPLESTRTLHAYLEDILGKAKKKGSSNGEFRSGLTKTEMGNVLSQVVKGVCFLDSVFVAHAALLHANITVMPADTDDLGTAKIVLTGLTRPIVFYNVESDQLITIKGFDPTADASLDPLDHLPSECFEPNFLAANLDAYSIGVLAYGMLRLRSPFAKLSQSKILATKQVEPVKLMLDKSEGVDHGQLPALIAALTQPQQRKRLQIDDVLSHAYFKQ